jgi:glutamate formiminotransferase/formiminotetrahydrofolate cyclodeaminase
VVEEAQRIRLAVERLGLSSVKKFDPRTSIVEYLVRDQEAEEPLASLSVRQFVEVLGSRAPAPGGGSASAVLAAVGAALGGMVGWLTFGVRK